MHIFWNKMLNLNLSRLLMKSLSISKGDLMLNKKWCLRLHNWPPKHQFSFLKCFVKQWSQGIIIQWWISWSLQKVSIIKKKCNGCHWDWFSYEEKWWLGEDEILQVKLFFSHSLNYRAVSLFRVSAKWEAWGKWHVKASKSLKATWKETISKYF